MENEMVYNAKHYTLMDNDLIRGKQDMSLQEARILRLLITQVVREDKDFKTYKADIIDLAQFLNIPENNLYRDIRTICYNLSQRVVQIGTSNPKEPWKIFSWLQMASYDGNGTLTLVLSDQIKPFILDLKNYFTQYQLSNILAMSSFYAIRLYELIKSDEYKKQIKFEYYIDFLREFFQCENKYKRINDFKRYVIDIAVREINGKSDIQIDDVDYLIRKRKTEKIVFTINLGKVYAYRRSKKRNLSNREIL